MKRRNDYKVAMAESMELEPLGGMDKPSDTKRNGINKYGKCYKVFSLKPNRCKILPNINWRCRAIKTFPDFHKNMCRAVSQVSSEKGKTGLNKQ